MIFDHILNEPSRPASGQPRHRFKAPEGWRLCIHCHQVKDNPEHHNLPDGWEPIETAPMNATEIEVIMVDGTTQIAHWAEDLSGEDQPAFKGWFVKDGEGRDSSFRGIDSPDGWRRIPK